MNSPFEQVGFNMTPQFQAPNVTNPVGQANFAATPKQEISLPSQPEADEYVKSAEQADIDILKAEIKEELRKEMEAEAQAEQKAQAKKEKKGPIRAIKDFVGSFKKFNATAAEYIKGTFKGIASGALIGSAAYGALTLAKKPGAAKVFGVIGAIGGLGVNLWQASLKANENRSIIDHKWGETPIKR